ncbi:hypothetical protein PR003_g30189 [Phytophthora rubi]|uniref:Uncharacterized protein n=1 Tax=Phytophthora rubi TaxID=129364 RepID=A0A6A4BH31_9STRA|nr:hypothetical protein PR003_g30189 [Phytophthora rubi]
MKKRKVAAPKSVKKAVGAKLKKEEEKGEDDQKMTENESSRDERRGEESGEEKRVRLRRRRMTKGTNGSETRETLSSRTAGVKRNSVQIGPAKDLSTAGRD